MACPVIRLSLPSIIQTDDGQIRFLTQYKVQTIRSRQPEARQRGRLGYQHSDSPHTKKTMKTKSNKATRSSIVCGALLAASISAHAATVTWDGGGGDNLWVTANNWSGNTVPAASDTVNISTAVTVNGLGLVPSGNLPAGVTVNLSNNAILTMSSGAMRVNNSNITVGPGSALTGGFWDLDDGDFTFANGSAATMSDWEQKDINTFTFQLGSSGFTALTPGAFRLGNGTLSASITRATYNVDMANYLGGIGVITLVDFTTDAASMNNTLFQTAGGLNVINNPNGYTANLQWNDTSEAIELNVTAIPEPSAFAIFGTASLLTAFRRRRLAVNTRI